MNPTNLTLALGGADEDELIAQWKFPSLNIDKIEIRKYHRAFNGRTVFDGIEYVDVWQAWNRELTGNYWFQYIYPQPDTSNAREVWYQLQIWPAEGVKWTATEAQAELEPSIVLPAWEAKKASFEDAVSAANDLASTGTSNRTAAQNAERSARTYESAGDYDSAKKKWLEAEESWNLCETAETDCANWCGKAAEYADELGYSTADYWRERQTVHDERAAYAKGYVNPSETDGYGADWAAHKAGADEEARLRAGRKGAACKAEEAAVEAHKNAVTAADKGSYAKAVVYELEAAEKWRQAASKWTDAASTLDELDPTRALWEGYAYKDAEKPNDNNAYFHEQHAAAYQELVDEANEIQAEKLQRPDTPSASFDLRDSGMVVIDMELTAKWATEVRVYRTNYGTSDWALVHTFTRTLPANGNENTWRAQWGDSTTYRGHGYRYYLVSATEKGRTSVRTEFYGPFIPRPSRPTELKAVLNGPDSVDVSWAYDGDACTVESFSVEESTFVTADGKNAWQANAADEIHSSSTESGAQRHYTVSGLEQGVKHYFRVRAQNDEGYSAYATVPNSESTLTVAVMVPAEPKVALSAPTNLRCTEIATGTVKVTWNDAKVSDSENVSLREGEKYVIQHTSNQLAFTNNIASEIDETDYVPTDRAHLYYSFANLELGVKHFFRLQKVGADDAMVWATTPESDASRWNENRCYVALAAASATLTPPTNLTATVLSDGSVRLQWTDSQSADDSYDIWHTTNSLAFANNAMGDISQDSFSEFTTSTTHRYTVTGIDSGSTLYAKVRKRNGDAVSSFTSVASAKVNGSDFCKPTGLYAEILDEATGTIIIGWSDENDEGATWDIEHHDKPGTWDLNQQGNIDRYSNLTYDDVNPTSVYPFFHYTVDNEHENIAFGKKHSFRIFKTVNGTTKLGLALVGGEATINANVTRVYLPPESSGSIGVPTGLTATQAATDGGVKLQWTATLGEGQSFEIQYTTSESAFADNAMGEITSIDYDGGSGNIYTITGVEQSATVYARIRIIQDDLCGAWSDSASAAVPPDRETMEDLSAPSCAKNAASYAIGDDVVLSWQHASAEGSEQSGYKLVYSVNGADNTYVTGTTDSAYVLDTDDFEDGTLIRWQVRTSGVYEGLWSPWSEVQAFRLYDRPSVQIALSQPSGSVTPSYPLESFPLTLSLGLANTLSSANSVIAWWAEIVASEGYETTGYDGETAYVAEGEPVWSGSIQKGDAGFSKAGWSVQVDIGSASFADGQTYIARGWALTTQGMRSEAVESAFPVAWDSDKPMPVGNAIFSIADLTCVITPACPPDGWGEELPTGDTGGTDVNDVATDEEVAAAAGLGLLSGGYNIMVDPGYGLEDQTLMPWSGDLRENTVLAVYRVNKDGSTELIADNMPNDGQTSCVDPHPTFGTCAYRIAATDTTTGVQGWADLSIATPCKSTIIQWGGNMVSLPFNVQEDDSGETDTVGRAFMGRRWEVAYSGPARKQSLRISADVVKKDAETVALLRRLKLAGGTCYVRTASGLGFNAIINSFSIGRSNDSVKVPVSIEFWRVEG